MSHPELAALFFFLAGAFSGALFMAALSYRAYEKGRSDALFKSTLKRIEGMAKGEEL